MKLLLMCYGYTTGSGKLALLPLCNWKLNSFRILFFIFHSASYLIWGNKMPNTADCVRGHLVERYQFISQFHSKHIWELMFEQAWSFFLLWQK